MFKLAILKFYSIIYKQKYLGDILLIIKMINWYLIKYNKPKYTLSIKEYWSCKHHKRKALKKSNEKAAKENDKIKFHLLLATEITLDLDLMKIAILKKMKVKIDKEY